MVNSSLTATRSAWNVRFAGLPPVRLAGAGIAAGAGGALADLEDAEPDDPDPVPLLEVLGDELDHVGQDGLGVLLGEVLALRDVGGEMLERNGGGSG